MAIFSELWKVDLALLEINSSFLKTTEQVLDLALLEINTSFLKTTGQVLVLFVRILI